MSMARWQARFWFWIGLCAALIAPSLAQATTTYFNIVFALDGSLTQSGVIMGSDGALYGTTTNTTFTSGGLIFRTTVDGGNPQTLYQLGTNDTDGYSPRAELLLASDGYFYGTTHFGPRSGFNQTRGSGSLFRIRQDGSGFETIHYFGNATDDVGVVNSDGIYPDAALIEGPDGYLYGVATSGGPSGTGTVFRTSKNGLDFLVLHQFAALDGSGFNTEGAAPNGKLLLASDGRLYGVTASGGAAGTGTVYSLSTAGGAFLTLHTFTDMDDNGVNADGAAPRGALVEVNGTLFGVAGDGGASSYGTVYSLSSDGTVFTTLHHFAGSTDSVADGSIPAAGLTLADDGRLYGTTTTGTVSPNGSVVTSYGTIFAVGADGSNYEVLHRFEVGQGSSPQSELFKADATTFFGTATAASSGPCGYGSVFRLSLSGHLPANGKTSCEVFDYGGGGGGSMGGGVLLLLSMFGLAPAVRWRLRARG